MMHDADADADDGCDSSDEDGDDAVDVDTDDGAHDAHDSCDISDDDGGGGDDDSSNDDHSWPCNKQQHEREMNIT